MKDVASKIKVADRYETAEKRSRFAELARQDLHLRQIRSLIFGDNRFAQPEWSMLLEIYIAEDELRPMLKMHAIRAAGVSIATASRYLAQLSRQGLIANRDVSNDRRSQEVYLTDEGCKLLNEYFRLFYSLNN